MQIVAIIIFFCTGILLIFGTFLPRIEQKIFRERLEKISNSQFIIVPEVKLKEKFTPRKWLRKILGNILLPKKTFSRLEQYLDQAGNPMNFTAEEFFAIRILSIVLMLILNMILIPDIGKTNAMRCILVILSIVIALTLPDSWLQRKIFVRKLLIQKSLPEVLDLIVVSMEAGIGFDSAMAHTISKMEGPLADELNRVIDTIRLGKARPEAIKEMAIRLDIAEVTSFVSTIIQADRIGSPIAYPLRLQSEIVRMRRLQHIREQAALLPTKMLFPLVFFLLPALFVVIIGPGLINLLQILSH